jgi:ubiquinone/menaquinone biosynthesis C-methylase UbiE
MPESSTAGPYIGTQQIGYDSRELDDILNDHEPIYEVPKSPEIYVKMGKIWVVSRSAEEYEFLMKMTAGVTTTISRKSHNGSMVTEIDLKDSNIDDKIILDAGCGIGKAIATATKKRLKLKIVGIDNYDASLEMASRALNIPIVSYDPKSSYQKFFHRNRYELRSVDATDLPIFADSSFDGVLARNLLQYIPHDLRSKAVSEWTRVTKPNGHLVMVCGGIIGQPNAYLRKEEIGSLVNVPSLKSVITTLYRGAERDIDLVYSTKLKI